MTDNDGDSNEARVLRPLQTAFGPMLIEVREGTAFVNGQRVPPFAELHEAGSPG